MALYNFHRVLIAVAILFDFGFTFWTIRQYNLTGDAIQLVLAVGSSVVTVGLVVYLVYFNRNLSVLRHILAARCVYCGSDLRRAVASGSTACPQCAQPIGDQVRRGLSV